MDTAGGDNKKKEFSLEDAKRIAAHTAVDMWINEDTKIVGVGSGSTIKYVVERIARRLFKEGLEADIQFVPTSFQSRQLILDENLRLTDLDQNPEIDVTIDGADEVDCNMTLIKGGGGCLMQEKIVASCAKNLVIVADWTKKSTRLGEQWCKGVPIEVIGMGVVPIMRKIEAMYGGLSTLRMAKAKAGPVITDNGNFLVDWQFVKKREYNWEEVNQNLMMIPGVLETGLFVKMAKKCFFGMPDGTVKVQNR